VYGLWCTVYWVWTILNTTYCKHMRYGIYGSCMLISTDTDMYVELMSTDID